MAKHKHLYEPPMMHDLKADNDALRDLLFADPTRDMWLHIGHFISWYAAAEFQITMMLFTLSGCPTPDQFDILTRGLDLQGKIDRLKRAGEAAKKPVGPNLAVRLDHLRGPIASLRNKIAHGFLMWRKSGMEVSSVGAPPLLGSPEKRHPALKPPEIIAADVIFERSLWTKAFAMDLGDLYLEFPRLKTLERDRYRTNLPPGTPRGTPPQAPRASAGKPSRKAP